MILTTGQNTPWMFLFGPKGVLVRMRQSNAADQNLEGPIKAEMYSIERLEEYAVYLARELKLSDNPKISEPLLHRLKENKEKLNETYQVLNDAIQRKDTLPPAAEWLTDNFHVVENQLREIEADLPHSFYQELPKIALGELRHYPRVYAISLALIAHTDSQLEPELIRKFVAAYQTVTPLTIGELWALAITLKLVLIENLRRIGVRVVRNLEKRNLANALADQFFEAAGEQAKFQAVLEEIMSLCRENNESDCALIAQLAKRLRDQEPEFWPALETIEKELVKNKSSTEQVVHRSHQQQAANQITVANGITSLRTLGSLDWRDFFEELSAVDKILRQDALYGEMDFLSRDQYRHVIERLSKKSAKSEMEIAVIAVEMSAESHVHIGEFLLGHGLEKLEARVGGRAHTPFAAFAAKSPALLYFGSLFFWLVLALVLPLSYASLQGVSLVAILGILLLLALPASDLAISFTNLALSHLVKPKVLPKLALEKGIPAEARTMVVIPCLLSNKRVVRALLEKIEIHYLGNREKELYFSLLTDFNDAGAEHVPEDDLYLQQVKSGIERLNKKYYPNEEAHFFLLHRKRVWNECEHTWMGWERKRGKIHEFNELLLGAKKTNFTLITASPSLLRTIRYVITLDADTQLPREAAKKLVGTILHPLHQAHFDPVLGRVVRGYGVLQPRIGISLESSARSLFAKIFSGYVGIDPYTTAVSDVYQDLFHEGIYTGKGLYDVKAFAAALEGKAPENAILSHDLFEGIYARAALVTDVELLDDYPQSYRSFFTRQHRWVRGDWQIAPWLFRGKLPFLSRWKIFENLRRSLVAPFTLLSFVAAWTLLPGNPLVWACYLMGLFALSNLLPSIFSALLPVAKKAQFYRWREALAQIKTSVLQSVLHFFLLAHQAYIEMDAIVRVSYRKCFSQQKLLEWATAAHVESEGDRSRPLWQSPWPIESLLLVFLAALFFAHPAHSGGAFFLLGSWICYPFFAAFVSRGTVKEKEELSRADTQLLRQIARRTWRYFENFVSVESNWLPPDNHQEFPHSLTAFRTSPTNIGLYFLSLVSARDFGYLSHAEFLRRLELSFSSLRKLEKYKGHYLNWYDLKTLEPLHPKYISTVDSGNLAGYLITLREACREIPRASVLHAAQVDGLKDAVAIALEELKEISHETPEARSALHHCQELLTRPPENTFMAWNGFLRQIVRTLQRARVGLPEASVSVKFLEAALAQAQSALSDSALFAPWAQERFITLFAKLPENLQKGLAWNTEFTDLALHCEEALRWLKNGGEAWDEFADLLRNAKNELQNLLRSASESALWLNKEFEDMDFSFLLDQRRHVFYIGYSVDGGKFDNSVYDLLASESRLASFIAIAKGDAPQEHWFHLGRQLVPIAGGRALVSWTASMFEYLMPLLVMRNYENTLLHETLETVVAQQIKYGAENRVPWGVSEAGYNARDLQFNYQYGPFGVPGLGLKRGLNRDLVISPYSTLLATMVDKSAALTNIKTLIHEKLLREFGFFEAIDYTTERLPENQKHAVIRSFMAHHQGMSLVALNNVLHHNSMQDRFHRDARVGATRLLLQERVPQGVLPVLPRAAVSELQGELPATVSSFVREYTNPSSSTIRTQVLSNRNYSLMISAAGGGYSKCGEAAVTRWREDATRDNWGSFIFLRDREEKKVWSATYQPRLREPDAYKVVFAEDRAEFRRRDGEISSETQIIVAPEDNMEIRHVTLTNHSSLSRVMELTSYLEPVLAPAASDSAHPAFSKLFIQTEFLPSKNALLAKRRKRSDHDKENWGLHVVVGDTEFLSGVEYETDRGNFIGRGRTLQNAAALFSESKFANTSGSTLDPILALRVSVLVPPNGKARVAFATGMAPSRDEALALADRYHDIHFFERESKLAWMQSQVDMRHFNVDTETAHLYQRLAERVLYSEPSLRAPTYQRAANTSVQSSLWPSGISGDLPIVVLSISDHKDMPAVRKLLRCHEYLRMKGVVYDFIILNEHDAAYFQDLHDEIQQQLRSTGAQRWLNKRGGVFVLRSDIIPEKDVANIVAVARVALMADLPLKEQVNRKAPEEKYPPLLHFPYAPAQEKKQFAMSRSAANLRYFNGYGGFGKNGQEYEVELKAGEWTPAPWLNVVGNKLGFGFQVSESGAGFTWCANSQANRLTPWSNDPVSDPPGEILYIRDDDTGEIWTPTPLPIRGEESYTIRHGQGYSIFSHQERGIDHTLTLFVPKEEPVKISLLQLKNLGQRRRRLSVVSYTEWVLGTQREKTFPHLVCNVDQESGAIFARNPHDNEFAAKVAFADTSLPARSFTCSRKEFLGRNGSYSAPAALQRSALSGKRGTDQDPCAAILCQIELAPGEEKELAALLGECDSAAEARALALRYRNLATAKEALEEVQDEWKRVLTAVQVKTPDEAMNTMMNHWLLYQTLSCRYWARTAFYQSGGAYGFRDQLQDSMAFVYAAPELTREHILRAAKRQFKEGDVQHWWHPPSGRGVRTRMSDDLLWLPYVVSFYIRVTGDLSILEEKAFFLEAALLKITEEDSYTEPRQSEESGTIREHCQRAIDRSLTLGERGLPLMGTGDWNDGMNRVGFDGKGESVWLAWFLHRVIEDFLPYTEEPRRELYTKHMQLLREGLEKNGWDGEWYRRAYFDDGTPLGSASNTECRIDSLSQSWAVLSKAGDPVRAKQAMHKLEELLVRRNSQIVLLFTPPFDKSEKDPGYIKGYVAGVRENGGQYTHAAAWAIMAFAALGDGKKAFTLFDLLNPISHARNAVAARKYRIEPYVLAGDVYSGPDHEGRGGWSWYTGSSSWVYRAGLESILGFHLQGDELHFTPCIPPEWPGFSLQYRYGKTNYAIEVQNPKGLSSAKTMAIKLSDDGQEHRVLLVMD